MRARAVIAVLVGITGVAVVAGQVAASTTSPGMRAAEATLRLWSRFPASAQPRPVVVPFGPGIVNPPRDQHESTVIYQDAWQLNQPSASDTATAQREGLISAVAAISALNDELKHAGDSQQVLPVRIQLGQAVFVTDRGRTAHTAWLFFFGHFKDPASVLAVRPYKAPPLRRLDPHDVGGSMDGEEAVTSEGGRRLRIFFTGGPAGNKPCDINYSGQARESIHAVAFWITEAPVPVPSGLACTLEGHARSVVVRLRQPLGPRVLVDGTDAGAIPAAPHHTF